MIESSTQSDGGQPAPDRAHSEFPYAEEELHRSWGVTRKMLREKRALLVQGTDWALIGHSVQWTQPGILQLAVLLDLHPEKLAVFVPPEEPAIEVLTVLSAPVLPDGRHFAQPGLIRARRHAGEVVTVKVLCPGKYVPKLANGQPMTFSAQKGQWGWESVGRCPRYVGRW